MDMNTDNIFSPSRTTWLMKKYFVENRGTLLMSGAFVTLVMMLIAVINGLSAMHISDPDFCISTEIGFMLVAFSVTGCLIASLAFRQIWDNKSATGVLMTPATAFEQCLVRWIFVVPGFIVWSLVSAMFADMVKYLTANYIFGGEVCMIPWLRILGVVEIEAAVNMYMVLLIFVVTQSFYFLGSVVWRKHNFVKTSFVIGLLFMIYFCLSAIVADSYTNPGYVSKGERDFLLYAPFQILLWLTLIINYTLTVMRLRESDIIHRL